ncbi:hypothetical protein [Hydrogenophaga sp. NFH-34]|uniref:hypothetical protein n=1 Tax=Hydrogenophaga sp. NFH-34 TaxID=2744446 RepID=UPI001F279689|nr:hypothetical protein [Hydrogenophaga sp. NFH-34]
MQAQIGQMQQVIKEIAEAGGTRYKAETWVGTAQAWHEVRHDNPRSIVWLHQSTAQPLLALHGLLAHTGSHDIFDRAEKENFLKYALAAANALCRCDGNSHMLSASIGASALKSDHKGVQ